MATPKRAPKEEARTPKAAAKNSNDTVTGGKSSAKSAAGSALGKRVRGETSNARGSEGEHKRPKGKQSAAEDEEEHVAQLKKLSSINGLESSSLAHPPRFRKPRFPCSGCAASALKGFRAACVDPEE